MAGKRKTAARKSAAHPRGALGADSTMSCPVIAAIQASQPQRARTRATIGSSSNGGGGGGSGGGSGGSGGSSNSSSATPSVVPEPPHGSDSGDTAAPSVAAIKGMNQQELLACLEALGVPAARDRQRGKREFEEARHMQAASRATLKDAAVFGRTTEGRQTYQTILTAHAYDVDDGPSTSPDYRKAEILGVDPAVFSAARQRAKSLLPTLHPAAEVEAGAYWH